MQTPYHIKVSLKNYYDLIHSGNWELPDFSKKCLICHAPDCAGYLGVYARKVICPILGFEVPDFLVMRFRCHGKGEHPQCSHVTFSLLPLELVPYRQLSLKFMILAVWIRLSRQLSLYKAEDAILDELSFLDDVGTFLSVSAQLSWEQMVKRGLSLFVSINIDMPGCPCPLLNAKIITDHKEGLLLFLQACVAYKKHFKNDPIRGPDGFAWDFFHLTSQVTPLAPFLFGTGSQHRN